jgi:hypothetical protein
LLVPMRGGFRGDDGHNLHRVILKLLRIFLGYPLFR